MSSILTWYPSGTHDQGDAVERDLHVEIVAVVVGLTKDGLAGDSEDVDNPALLVALADSVRTMVTYDPLG